MYKFALKSYNGNQFISVLQTRICSYWYTSYVLQLFTSYINILFDHVCTVYIYSYIDKVVQISDCNKIK